MFIDFIKFILLLISFSGYSFAFKKILKVEIEYSFILLLSFIIFVLYLAGWIVGDLTIITYLIYLLGFSSFLYFIFLKRDEVQSFYKDNSIIVFLLLVLFFFMRTYPSYISYIDAFGHWALQSKEIILFNNFLLNERESSVIFREYQPGINLLHYFILKLLGFSEGKLLFTHIFIFLSAFLPFIAMVKKKKLLLLHVAALIGIIVLILPSKRISYMQIDGILSVLFALLFFSYFNITHRSKYLIIFFISVFIALLKPAGVVLILFASVMFLINSFMIKETKYSRKYLVIFLLALNLVSLALKYSWKLYIDLGPKVWNKHQLDLSQQYDVIISYIQHMVNFSFDKSMILLYLLIFLSFKFVSKSSIIDRQQMKLIYGGMFAFFIFYIIALLDLYLTVFPYEIALDAASHPRYLRVVTMAWALIAYGYFIRNYTIKKNNYLKIILVIIFITNIQFFFNSKPVLKLSNYRAAIKQDAKKLKDNLSLIKKQNLKILWLDYSLVDCTTMNYELAPYSKEFTIDKCTILSSVNNEQEEREIIFQHYEGVGKESLFVPRSSERVDKIFAND